MPNYSGMWTLQAQMQAVSQGTWTGITIQTAFSWGNNQFGGLALNDTVNRSSPTQIGTVSWSKVVSGTYTLFYIKPDGTLWACGYNAAGSLGQNDIINRSSPVQVGALTTWQSVASRATSVIAIRTDGTMWSWGTNASGELGLNDRAYRSSPVQIGALTTWSKAAIGSNNTLAIKTDGTLWSWGSNAKGQLGLNIAYTINRSSPVQVGANTNWHSVSIGNSQVLARVTTGAIYAWGSNSDGQLGQGDQTSRSSPVQIGALTTWLTIEAGGYSQFSIKNDGTLWSWGANQFGGLGQNITGSVLSPVQVGSDTTWSAISSDNVSVNGVLALKTNGTLWSWGYNDVGQLGQNNLINRSSPVQVGSGTTWSMIAAGRGMFAVTQFST